MADVPFHPEAKAEYAEAWAWYWERSSRAAERFEAEVERVLARIAENPEAFPHCDDEHQYSLLRRFPYSVVYQVVPEGVFIVAVAHSSRAPGYWEDRT